MTTEPAPLIAKKGGDNHLFEAAMAMTTEPAPLIASNPVSRTQAPLVRFPARPGGDSATIPQMGQNRAHTGRFSAV